MIINIPLFILAGYKIGKEYFIKSLIGTVSLSLFIDILDKYPPVTTDKFLASIYGGVIIGIGTAIILKSNSSTGGTELVANLIKSYNPYIPNGFTYKEGTWDTGYVIVDNNGNEYVWVPCSNKVNGNIPKLEKVIFSNETFISKDICINEGCEKFLTNALLFEFSYY